MNPTDRQPTGTQPLESAIARLCERLGVAELYVFGSRAAEVAGRVRGKAGEQAADLSSDVDVGVRPARGRFLHVATLVELADRLERLFDVRRVDVVLLNTAKPFLALDIVRGELLYCADADEQAEYELYVLRRAGDLAPFQRLRQELALSRFGER